jgi:oligopeptide transport system ATP-binding protein
VSENGGGAPLLSARDVKKHFPIKEGTLVQREVARVHAVDGVSLDLFPGETVGLVGESGCGKSTFGRCVIRLYDLTDGTITFDGQDITTLGRKQMRPLRREIQMVFQDPYASLNPRKRVGQIISDPMRIHHIGGDIKAKTQQLLERVGLSPEHYNRYPHEFSGGQRQRIGVARALALNPKLIVADEPVSALDVSIQAQILELIKRLRQEFDSAIVLITHDMGVVADIADRVVVMYAGRIVEQGPKNEVFRNPQHPYTWGLLNSIPRLDRPKSRRLSTIPGQPPSMLALPSGCRFRPRCAYAFDRCAAEDPMLEPRVGENHLDACFLTQEQKQQLRVRAAEPPVEESA